MSLALQAARRDGGLAAGVDVLFLIVKRLEPRQQSLHLASLDEADQQAGCETADAEGEPAFSFEQHQGVAPQE